ncbi:MAG: NADP-dependent malic enzyme [Erysipelotrichaceae bacterium]|nr:NADP-dependent malic enzyme [Erysipelotrichaceae bacterium]
MSIKEEALKLHTDHKGKLEIKEKVSCTTPYELTLAYTPGVSYPCLEIAQNKSDVNRYTNRGNCIAVVSDGTAVLGLGNIGPEAGLPVMEGKALLFKHFANVDAFPLCVGSTDVEDIVKFCKMLEPSIAGINLEDISAPRCVEIERRLQKEMNIPVFHDDQHGTAMVVLAGLINGLKVVGKKKEDCKVVISGTGAAGSSIIKHLYRYGFTNIIASDKDGILRQSEKEQYNFLKQELLECVNKDDIPYADLREAMVDADIFIGVSAPNLVDEDMIRSMKPGSIVFAMANPTPEITYEKAKAAGATIAGTGRSDVPNQINNLLAFPGLFRGLLDAGAVKMQEDIKIEVSKALAGLVAEEDLSADCVIPSVFDERVVPTIAKAVKEFCERTGNTR